MNLRSGRPQIGPSHLVRPLLTEQNLRALDSASTDSLGERTPTESSVTSMDPGYPLRLARKGIHFQRQPGRPNADAPSDLAMIRNHLRVEKHKMSQQQANELLQRMSLSCNEEVFKVHFVTAVLNPLSRRTVEEYSIQMDLEWTKVRDTSMAIDKVPNPKPDYFESFSTLQYPQRAWDALGWSVNPVPHDVAMPVFCVEFKAQTKSTSHAATQAAYDGAVMVQSAWEIHKRLKKPAQDFFGQTQALVMAVGGDGLRLFACHAKPLNGATMKKKYPKEIEYHVFPLVFAEINDLDNVCRLVYNAQDWCRTKAESTKTELWDFFGIPAEIRARHDAKRVETNTKRRAESVDSEQAPPTKRPRVDSRSVRRGARGRYPRAQSKRASP